MADANARREAIKQASQQVRAGDSAFVRRANTTKVAATAQPKPQAPKKQ